MESIKRLTEPFFFSGNSTGILLVHGFTGSPSEMRFLGERLAAEGWTVFGVRLSGHGTTPEDLSFTGWEDWVEDVESGLRKLREVCERVIGVGFSMGGLLVLHLAAKDLFDGIICMNAPMILQDWGAKLARFYKPFIKYVSKPKAHLQENAQVSQTQERFVYDRVPVSCIESVNQGIRIVRKEIGQISVPVFLMQSVKDRTVDPVSLQHIKERMKITPDVQYFEKSGHILPLGPEREEVAVRAASFIRKLEGSKRPPKSFG